MRAPIDVLLAEAARTAVRAAPAVARMATVGADNGDGTVDVSLPDGSTVPRVRILTHVYRPAVGHVVEILNTAGGWVLLGRAETSSAPRIQRGTVTVPNTVGGQWSATTGVVFPDAFTSTPALVLTPNTSIPGPGSPTPISWGTPNVTTVGFDVRVFRGNVAPTDFAWIATDL